MPHEEPLGIAAHAQVPGEQDVQPRGGVPGAGADHEQADVAGGQAGAGERPADRLLAQRQRLHQVAPHPPLGRPLGDVLDQRVDDRLPGVTPEFAKIRWASARVVPE